MKLDIDADALERFEFDTRLEAVQRKLGTVPDCQPHDGYIELEQRVDMRLAKVKAHLDNGMAT